MSSSGAMSERTWAEGPYSFCMTTSTLSHKLNSSVVLSNANLIEGPDLSQGGICFLLVPQVLKYFPPASYAHQFSPTTVLVVPVKSSYDEHINLTDLRTPSKASFTWQLPPVHLDGHSSPSQSRLLGHLTLPISPAATNRANSLFLVTSYLARNSSHFTCYHLRDDLDCSQLPLSGRLLPLHSQAATG